PPRDLASHSLPTTGSQTPGGAQSGRGHSVFECPQEPQASHDADDALRDRRSGPRTRALASPRHRPCPLSYPRSRWQGKQGSADAVAPAFIVAAGRLLANLPPRAQRRTGSPRNVAVSQDGSVGPTAQPKNSPDRV